MDIWACFFHGVKYWHWTSFIKMETWECIHYGCGHYSNVCPGSTYGQSMSLWAQGSQGNRYGCIYHWSMLWVVHNNMTLCHTYLIRIDVLVSLISFDRTQFWTPLLNTPYLRIISIHGHPTLIIWWYQMVIPCYWRITITIYHGTCFKKINVQII